MGKILKVGDQYYVEFFGNGLRFQKKVGPKKEEAKRKLQEIEDSLKQTALKVDVSAVTVNQFFDAYLNYAQQVHSSKTFKRFNSTVNHFKDFIKDKHSDNLKLSLITPKVIEEYQAYLLHLAPKRKTSVINFTLYLLRDVIEYAINLGWLNDNPTLHVRFCPRLSQREMRVLTDDELLDILKNSEDDIKDMLCLLLKTGIRLSELQSLRMNNIDLNNNVILVDTHQEEGLITRSIPMDASVIELVKRLKVKESDEVVFNCKDINSRIAKAINKANLAGVHISTFRHTFANNVIKRGVSLVQLNQLLGYDDIAKVFRFSQFINNPFSS